MGIDNNTNERSFSKLDKTDIAILLILAAVPIIIYNNILKQGYVSFFDLTLPSNWMRIYPNNLEGYLAGLNYYNTISSANLNNSFTIFSVILVDIFGSYGLHIAAIMPQILLGPFAYLFSRYFIGGRKVSIILPIFVMFNPYVMMFTFDNIANIFSYEFIMPFIISYFELRVKKNSKAAPFVLLFLILPSIYGAVLPLYFGTILILETSLFFASLDNIKRYIKNIIFLPITVGAYVLINIEDVINKAQILGTLLTGAPSYPPHFNIVQILTFQATYPYESGLTNFLPRFAINLLEIAFLILFIISISALVLGIRRAIISKNRYLLTLFIFASLFSIYSIGVLSVGSNYFYINRLISIFLPEIYVIDPWSNGIYDVIMYLLLTVSLVVSIEDEQRDNRIVQNNSSVKLHKRALGTNVRKSFLSIILSILILSSAFYIVPGLGLNNSFGTGSVPASDITAYKFLENNTDGFIFTIPTTYAISFNYTKEYTNAYGVKSSPTDATFWWNFPPARLYRSGPFYQDLIDSLYYSSNIPSYYEFNNLATISGIEYIVNFNPSTIVQIWGSPPPLSDSYILNHTDFKLIYTSNAVSIFKNPAYRGLSYTSNLFLVSNDPVNATVRESQLNLSLPVITPQQFQNLSLFRSISGVTFNESIYAEIKNNLYLLVPYNRNVYIYRQNISLVYPNLLTSLPTSNISIVNNYGIFQNGLNNTGSNNAKFIFGVRSDGVTYYENVSSAQPFSKTIRNFTNKEISVNVLDSNNKALIFTIGNITVGISPYWNDITLTPWQGGYIN
ncbi:MAG: hypothetical protein QXO75_11590, partial [Nitrososphaerota archaeon]